MVKVDFKLNRATVSRELLKSPKIKRQMEQLADKYIKDDVHVEEGGKRLQTVNHKAKERAIKNAVIKSLDSGNDRKAFALAKRLGSKARSRSQLRAEMSE